MAASKIVEALAAIDHAGKWVVYGFEGLDTIDDLHEAGVTEDLQDPVRYFRVRVILYPPEETRIEDATGSTTIISEPKE